MAAIRGILAPTNETVFVRPGDLHLENRDSPNFRVAQWMVSEINELVKPDFVQFAGDNVQNARAQEYDLFSELTQTLNCPWEPMVGDHDVHEDPQALSFQKYCGLTYKSMTYNENRFIRLNTLEHKPVGFTERQLDWLESELYRAQQKKQRVILFQHHYPFKVLEEFEGPGIERWRGIVQSQSIEAILCGHTHYGQIANDGKNISIATRSIGDPEGGPPGYHLFYLAGERFACTYREFGDSSPIILITSPREYVLARNHKHICNGTFEIQVLIWSFEDIRATAQVDDGAKFELERSAELAPQANVSRWSRFCTDKLEQGVHRLQVEAHRDGAPIASRSIEFYVDSTGRFTAIPRVVPWVSSTKFS